MTGVDSDRFVKVCHRSVKVSYRGLRNPAIVVGHHVTRVALERLIEVRQGTIKVAFAKPKISPVVKGHRQTRYDIERLGVVRNGSGKFAACFISKTTFEVSRRNPVRTEEQ